MQESKFSFDKDLFDSFVNSQIITTPCKSRRETTINEEKHYSALLHPLFLGDMSVTALANEIVFQGNCYDFETKRKNLY